ncbi:MAG TPA: type II toxin-antitoxin system RelE/ParE family toxin [Xanthobacteraceae bacterium]|jgi:proteic killer suppression protein
MIRSFKSNALERYWTKGQEGRIKPEWRKKMRLVLSRLDAAEQPGEMNAPGYGFHALTGNLRGRYAVRVSHNWRITFAWSGKDAIDVDLEDYHGR